MPCEPTLFEDIPIFSLLDGEERVVLAEHVEFRRFTARQRIYRPGDSGGRAYLVIGGRVQVIVVDEDHQEVVIDSPGAGEIFGLASMLSDSPHETSAIAQEETTASLLLPMVGSIIDELERSGRVSAGWVSGSSKPARPRAQTASRFTNARNMPIVPELRGPRCRHSHSPAAGSLDKNARPDLGEVEDGIHPRELGPIGEAHESVRTDSLPQPQRVIRFDHRVGRRDARLRVDVASDQRTRSVCRWSPDAPAIRS
jgi:hypothetical protein